MSNANQAGRVTSNDGTPIAFDVQGRGPALILVGGGAVDRTENAPLAPALAASFTVYNYDRRGRGASGDTPPYAVEREIEDLAAVIAEAGGSAHAFGVSSGGALALEAAAAGLAIDKIGVYEVPYNIAGDWPQHWSEYRRTLGALLDEGRRGDAFELFMRLAGSPDEVIRSARNSPEWTACEAIAHTLAYDAACMGNGQPPVDRLRTVRQPVLVATGNGTDSHMTTDFFGPAADAMAEAMPNARRTVVENQSHVVHPTTFAPVLERFLNS